MIDQKLLPAAIAAAIAMNVATTAMASSGPERQAREIAAVLGAQTSIARAIIVAESLSGGRAMKVEMERDKGVYLYEIKTVSKDKVLEVRIDPATGKIVKTDEEGFIAKMFDKEDREEFDKLAASPMTLAAAIATAEKETGGKTMEAEFESEDGKSMFEVKVVKDDAVRKVKIDASNGKILKISDTRKRKDKDD